MDIIIISVLCIYTMTIFFQIVREIIIGSMSNDINPEALENIILRDTRLEDRRIFPLPIRDIPYIFLRKIRFTHVL